MSSYWIQILTYFGINAITAIGLYFPMMTGQLSVCQGALMGVGAYGSSVLMIKFGLPFWVTILGGAISGAVIGAFLSWINLRVRELYLAISTLAFGEVMVVIIINMDYLGGPLGLTGIPLKTSPYIVFLVLVVLVFFLFRFEKSRLGIAFRATGDNEITAGSMGIHTSRMKVKAFALGGFITAIGGALFAHYMGNIEAPEFGYARSLDIILFNAVGGIGTFWGPIAGSAFLTVLPEVLRFSVWARYLFFGILLIIIMIFRPGGLIIPKYGPPQSFFGKLLSK